jgi:hypothetical protein
MANTFDQATMIYSLESVKWRGVGAFDARGRKGV